MMEKFERYPHQLFVYGLLRKASGHDMSLYLRKHAHYLGTGYIHGMLYLVDRYPGAVIDDTFTNKITGDIYGFEDRLLWTALDSFEEVDISDEYLRKVVDVHVNLRNVKCWTYVYNRSSGGLSEIISGDFIRYMNSNQGDE